MRGYKESLTTAMTEIAARDPAVRFIGYNVRYGRFGGTLTSIDENRLIETPTAENLMAGVAIGSSLNGFLPILCFERFDFIFGALDAIVNHLDKMASLSHGQYRPRVALRIVVGNSRKPLFTGSPHTQDHTEALRKLVSFPVLTCDDAPCALHAWSMAYSYLYQRTPVAVIEYKDLYE